MSNYICDGCKEQIPPQKARMHCQTCPDYDTCTNCYVLGVVTSNHTAQHPITLVRNSGVSDPPTQSNPGNGPGQRSFSAQPSQQPKDYGPGQNPFTVWTPLFNADSTPGPDFVTMMQQFFGCLDPSRTGYLTPEAYSSFMEVQGFPTVQIVCTSLQSLTAHVNYSTFPRRRSIPCPFSYSLRGREPSWEN
jgi:hypothetical protein